MRSNRDRGTHYYRGVWSLGRVPRRRENVMTNLSCAGTAGIAEQTLAGLRLLKRASVVPKDAPTMRHKTAACQGVSEAFGGDEQRDRVRAGGRLQDRELDAADLYAPALNARGTLRLPGCQAITLFASKRDHRIDVHRPPRRQVTRRRRHAQQQHRDARERPRVGRAHAEQQARHQPRQPEAAPSPITTPTIARTASPARRST